MMFALPPPRAYRCHFAEGGHRFEFFFCTEHEICFTRRGQYAQQAVSTWKVAFVAHK